MSCYHSQKVYGWTRYKGFKLIRNIEILLVTLLLFDLGQNNLIVFDKFGMVIPFLATFASDVSAQVSFNKATKGSFRGKNTCKICFFEATFLMQKRWRASKTISMYLTNLGRSYLVQLHIFWKRVHSFNKN